MPYKTDVTDEQFQLIKPVLDGYNAQFSGRGRPRAEDRPLLNGMLWRLDNGAKWRAIPLEYGKWYTIYARFREWAEAGVFEQVIASLQAQARAEDRISFDFAAIDGTIVRAHKSAAGAKKRKHHT